VPFTKIILTFVEIYAKILIKAAKTIRRFPPQVIKPKGGEIMNYITWTDFFSFCVVILTLLSVIAIYRKK